MAYKFLFGPVNSRRLGISLGVDMVPFKTCSLDCVYCECGNTTQITCERKEYVRAKELIEELSDYLSPSPKLDYVTFAGSGEPTLNSCIGEVLTYVKTHFPQYKTALLTNGTLLYDPELRNELLGFDLICPSIDAISDEAFEKVNRPQKMLSNQRIIDGLIQFSKMYNGQLWVEVFIVPGVNDSNEELALFKETLQKMNLNRVQLNSLDRPGACDWVTPVSSKRLNEIASFFAPLPVEIISRSGSPQKSEFSTFDLEETVLSLLKRRPSTLEELSVVAGRTINEVSFVIEQLKCDKKIEAYSVGSKSFLRVSKQ